MRYLGVAALALILSSGDVAAQWATRVPPTPTRRPPPPPTRPPAATPTPTRPAATATPTPAPTPSSGLNYYLVPLVPVLPFTVGSRLRYADGGEVRITIRTSDGESTAVIMRIE